jgi:hypothetical protein
VRISIDTVSPFSWQCASPKPVMLRSMKGGLQR